MNELEQLEARYDELWHQKDELDSLASEIGSEMRDLAKQIKRLEEEYERA